MSGLFGSSIIEMALGLFFLYWLLSVICSSIWEMIAALFKLRAVDLERGLANLVCEPAVFHAVMAHPAITAVGNTDAETTLVQLFTRAKGIGGRPSYISAHSFSLAFLDTLAPVQNGGDAFQAVRDKAVQLIHAAAAPGPVTMPLDQLYDQVRANLQAQLAQTPPSSEKKMILRLSSASLPDALRQGLKLPSWHPVRLAVARSLETGTASDVYAWAATLNENDQLYTALISSVEGKQRLGQILLNLTDREVTGPDRARLIGELYALSREIPEGALREQFTQLLGSGDLAQVRDLALSTLPTPLANRIVGTLDHALADFSALRAKVEGWFNESMEHVSGVYKRRAKTWIFLIALLVVTPSGADSLRFASTLYANPTLRDVLVRDAEFAVALPTPAPSAAGAAGAANPQTPPAPTPAPAPGRLTAGEAAQELSQFGQLFGFADHPALLPPQPTPDQVSDWVGWILSRVLGSLLTAFAISMGAPFWFDVLGKVVNMRSANKDGALRTDTTTRGRSAAPASPIPSS